MNVDVLVVGGCTAGLYFGGLMAAQGYKVLVCDSAAEDKIGSRYTVIHVGKEYFDRFGIPEPKPGDSDYVTSFNTVILLSARNRFPKKKTIPTLVLRRHELMRRIGGWAKDRGVELLFGAEFKEPLFDEKRRLAGAMLSCEGKELRIGARLVADASGFPAAVRTSLPEDYGIETFRVGPESLSFLILHYVKLRNPEKDRVNSVTTWYPYHIWLAPSNDPGPRGALIGVGTGRSYENAERSLKEFLAKGFLPEYDLDFIEKSNNCRHRSLFNFTADGFVALGDAACVINPKTGEAVRVGWQHGSIAADVAGHAMRDGAYPFREKLWALNPRFMKDGGALYAMEFASRTAASHHGPEEMDYMFEHSIFYRDEKEAADNLTLKLIKAQLSGGLSRESVREIKTALSLGRKIYKHYMAYPEDSERFGVWAEKARNLWEEAQALPGADVLY
ncbi:MAG: FAD-dependent monooxygenase [Treponema sp.]|jgi:flavin-dependent dehydrogenase|nr:FAD-dependent monooxygenase [Treponema sp.]